MKPPPKMEYTKTEQVAKGSSSNLPIQLFCCQFQNFGGLD